MGTAAGAQLASIAVLDLVTDSTARAYHPPGLAADIADRYQAIAADPSTPLGAVLTSGGEVWLSSLDEVAIRYPDLLEDTRLAGLEATAAIALTDRQQQVIGAVYLRASYGLATHRHAVIGESSYAQCVEDSRSH